MDPDEPLFVFIIVINRATSLFLIIQRALLTRHRLQKALDVCESGARALHPRAAKLSAEAPGGDGVLHMRRTVTRTQAAIVQLSP
jgi:hypothetical protein